MEQIILFDSSKIPCKKYPTFGDLKAQPEKTQILTVAKMPDSLERDYLDKWIYDKHYSKKACNYSLTGHIKNISNIICYRKIVKECLNGNNIINKGQKVKVLENKQSEYLQELHKINPSLFGSFIDYLLRRIIAEDSQIPFYDGRSERYAENHVCDTGIDYNKKSRKELLEMCKQHQLKKYHKLNCTDLSDLLSKSVKTCKFESKGMNGSCNFSLCQKLCLEKVRKIHEFKTESIVKEILIASLIHQEAFRYAPSQESLNALWNKLECDEKNIEYIINPLKKIYKENIGFTTDILFNPAFGGTLLEGGISSIPSDADLIVGDTLIDIKCVTQDKKISEFLQLFGYGALCYLHPSFKRKIKKFQILNILEGTILTYDVDFLTKENCMSYIKLLNNLGCQSIETYSNSQPPTPEHPEVSSEDEQSPE